MNVSENNSVNQWSERTGVSESNPTNSFALKEAIIENQAGDKYRVRLIANPLAKSGTLVGFTNILKSLGYEDCFADVQNGEHVLIVRGLTQDKANLLPNLMQQKGYLSIDGIDKNLNSKQESRVERLKRDTLKWSGRFAMAGSAGVALAGAGQQDWQRLQTGLTLMAADSVVAVYGNGKNSIDFDSLFRDMNKHFEHNGIHLPDIANPEKRLGAIAQVNHFIAKHPVELNYSLGMLSGIGHMRSGYAAYQQSGAGISRMTKGFLGAAGSAGVVFLPENKERRNTQKPFSYYMSNPLEIPKGLGDFILASPIRFKGMLSSVYSLLYLTDTFEEKKKMKLWAEEKGGLYNGKNHTTLTTELGATLSSQAMKNKDVGMIEKASDLRKGISELEHREQIAKTVFGGTISPYLSAFTAICYLASSLLSAASSKNRHDSFETSTEFEPMYAMATRTVAMLPLEDRANALTQIATYLSIQKDVKDGEINAPKIIEEVRKRLEKIEQSPWIESKVVNRSIV